MARFDTVVLFDVENLLGAPRGWEQAAAKLSFGEILAQLRRDDSGAVGRIAVSRAYANWSRVFMEALRWEMTENGIEPRQIFGFDPAGRKNAADIELVIDAMDLAYIRPELTTFVLVSRDGGFAALARKLHELGKSVVVCADSRCALALRSVADVFVSLPAPEERLARAAEEPGRAAAEASERVLDETRATVLREIAKFDAGRLEREGITLQTVGQRFSRAIPSLGEVRSGYGGLREFLQWALAGTEYCVMDREDVTEGAQSRVGRRARLPEHAIVLPDRERRLPRKFADQATLYRFLAIQGEPYVRLAEPASIARVLTEVARSQNGNGELAALIDRTALALSGIVTAEDVRFTLLALGDGTAGKSARQLRSDLLATVRTKLETRINPIDDAVLESLID